MANSSNTSTIERDDLLQGLAEQRHTLLITVRGIDDAQARVRTTASELTLGGLVKHVTRAERVWTHVMTGRAGEPAGMFDMSQYRMDDDETLPALLDDYAAAARGTDEAAAAVADLGAAVLLPEAPWLPGLRPRWSVRLILLHLIRETAQHAGHADIIRESLDGANTTAQLST